MDLIGREAPEGTKLWLLHIGNLKADEAFFIAGANVATASKPNPEHVRRSLVMVAALISHPTEGLILFETGAGKDYPTLWGPQLNDIFAREDYVEDQELDAAIRKTGNDIKDVKAVIMGHLHLDHAGGLEHFRGTNVPIYTHELELKHAFYSVATKTDIGVYLPSYLQYDLNWTPFHGHGLELAKGLMIRHCPGHTPGLCVLQVTLKNSGTWIFTTDHYIVKENYESLACQGWFTRDHATWLVSSQMIKSIQKLTDAKLIFGHDRDALFKFKLAPNYYD
ncbi:beta-lactamase-like protein [Boeremia exigua]|uniref:beta-lactamase-like protein n=1 Tax=Boeremia exigua TaxID=749465 RepID=UPI001E8EBCD3|nr:beta-lactamase-like protein [Boeremia exigua]KAH6618824.1 beta-lactamase-like protein [Boeremia exigua]